MTDRDGRVTTYAYNGLNEKVREQWLDGSTVLRTLSYAYDAVGNLTSTSDPSASYTYAYDSLNRPTSVTTQGLRIKIGVFQHVQQVVRVEGGFHPFGFGAVLRGLVLSQ